jgi:sec-independent protein translocase protein TatA
MAGLTPAHLLIILVIALIVIGPGKLPEVGAAIGKSVREFQKAAGQIQDPLNGTLQQMTQQPAQQQAAPIAPQVMQPQAPAQSFYAAQPGYVAQPYQPAQPAPAGYVPQPMAPQPYGYVPQPYPIAADNPGAQPLSYPPGYAPAPQSAPVPYPAMPGSVLTPPEVARPD